MSQYDVRTVLQLVDVTYLVANLVVLAGIAMYLAARVVAAVFVWRHPELAPPRRPAISPAMEYDLLGRDNDATRDILVGTPYRSGRPIYAIEAAPVSRSRS